VVLRINGGFTPAALRIWLHRWQRTILAGVLALIFPLAAFADLKPDVTRLVAGPVAVEAEPIAEFKRGLSGETRFGRLEWRGGLKLTSPSPNFGGWSGLVMDPDGRKFVSISDSGIWLTGELSYNGNRLAGVQNARMGPLLDEFGMPFRRDRDRDSEAVALVNGTVANGSFLVAFEQNHRILRYDLSRDGFSPVRGVLALPADAKKMRRNNGFEAMTVMRGGAYKGATIAMSEHYLDSHHNHTGWIWAGATPQKFNLTNVGDFEVTDMASLEDGTLYVLERRFRWVEGVKMRLRRLGPADIQPGLTATGEVLLEADYEFDIDNMEGLGVSRGRPGETIITLISDDNFNPLLQRTILLQFSLSEPQTAKARPDK
jgi:hypothetical protein